MNAKEKTILAIFGSLTITCWCFIIFKVVVSSMPYNAFSGSQIEAYNFRNVLPEGWGFFTRNPREDNYYIYKKDIKGHYTVPAIYANNNFKNGFGVKRTSRIQSMELGVLIQRAEKYPWADCPNGNSTCSAKIDTLTSIPILNTTAQPTLCGEFLLTQKETVPWAWGKSYFDIDMPAKTIKINSICYTLSNP